MNPEYSWFYVLVQYGVLETLSLGLSTGSRQEPGMSCEACKEGTDSLGEDPNYRGDNTVLLCPNVRSRKARLLCCRTPRLCLDLIARI